MISPTAASSSVKLWLPKNSNLPFPEILNSNQEALYSKNMFAMPKARNGNNNIHSAYGINPDRAASDLMEKIQDVNPSPTLHFMGDIG